MNPMAMFVLLAASGVGLPAMAEPRPREPDEPPVPRPPPPEATPEELAALEQRMQEWRVEMDRREERQRDLARMSEVDRARVLRESIESTPKGQKAAAKRERIRQRNLRLAGKAE